MHLDEAQVQRLLHQELGLGEASARDHLAACPECRSRVTEAEREESWVFDRLRLLDHAAPRVSGAAIASPPRRRARGWDRLAAGIVLALAAAGVAYAAPGSPFPGVVHRMIQWVGHTPTRAPLPTPAPDASQVGIAVAPGDRLAIVFPAEQPGGMAIVSLTDGGDVVVRALDGATFTSDVQRLSIEHVGKSARYEILIPRTALSVEIRVRGRQVFLKEASRIVADAHPDSAGRYLVPLSAAKP